MNLGTPNVIEVLLHCHVCPTVHERIDAPAVQEAIAKLLSFGAIEPHDDIEGRFNTTEFGKAWVTLLCNVSGPRLAYFDGFGNEIKALSWD